MTIANAEQFDSWNGESGTRWVARADERDAVLAPVAAALLDAADLTPGLRVLDIGCGCGATTLAAAARIGPDGTATGIDLSAPMLDVAQQRAASAGATNASFIRGDAQDHPFEPASIDLAISRFGTMFFADPVAAFANVAAALRPGGSLYLAAWQPLAANDWLTVPGSALLQHTDLPATSPDGPGMFSQSDPDAVADLLTAAGLVDVALDAVQIDFDLGPIDAAVDYLADSGPGRLLLEAIPEGPARRAALSDVRRALVDHVREGRVRLGGGLLLVVAATPIDATGAAHSSGE